MMKYFKKIVSSILDGTLVKKIRFRLFLKKHANHTNLDDKEYLTKIGKIFCGRKFSIDDPHTFNEKINWYKLNYFDDKMRYVVDKVNAKDYVIEKGLSEIIVNTITIYESIDEMNLSDLPSSFVVKNTCDSGSVFICKDKESISLAMIKEKLSRINKEIYNGHHFLREKVYENQHNRIIVEELIKTSNGRAPYDYKFFCFMGEPIFFFIASNREKSVKMDYFDMNCNKLPIKRIGHGNSKEKINIPKNFNKMVEVCRVLSKDFPFVRIDLYNENGNIFFSEFTFYNSGGIAEFKPKKWNYILGSYIDTNKIKTFNSKE